MQTLLIEIYDVWKLERKFNNTRVQQHSTGCGRGGTEVSPIARYYLILSSLYDAVRKTTNALQCTSTASLRS